MKHADLTDIANETADLILDQALLHQSKVAARAKRSYSEDCIECGDIIPAQRQQATGGTNICVGCLETLEKISC